VGRDGQTAFPATSAPATSIPADSAVCADCLAELRDPTDRRFGYPFIACTHCGPRFTITTGLPYDRDSTTMVDFPLCPDCRAEYDDPTSRRFHAQPTACPLCGPQLSMPIAAVVSALAGGRIVAIKGIGGYHLACDAQDPQAVARLRARKRRGDKPFAVMVRDLPTARTIAALGPLEAEVLTSAARPIVLLAALDAPLQCSVAPGNDLVGVMLPYAPLHHLVFDAGAPAVLVMTSGNLADEPICIDPDEAEQRLASIADVFCHHDRRIHVACDDSVLRVVAGHPQPVRRSRGYAPLPVSLPLTGPPLVAVGGELKATAALAAGRRAWLTQHVGDTENLETLDMLARSIDTLTALQQVTPTALVSDAHPGYLSHGWAARRASTLGIPHLVVQHHHAHLASLLAEHAIDPSDPVLGVVLDGTGYGTDATIWGGELLLGSYASVERVGHLRPVLLPGGDAAIRFPARTAVAHLTAAGLAAEGSAPAEALGGSALRLLGQMLAIGSHCVPTTSMGRLFDAVSSLLDVRHEVDYEAQAAIELEALSGEAGADGAAWPGATLTQADAGGPLVIDPTPWIARALADHAGGVPVTESARAFHIAVADALTQACVAIRAERGVSTVGLTGGVFANAILTGACLARLGDAGFSVLTHRVVPPNDGGLALGQVAVAAAGGAVPAGAMY
jgi:hydrogenase maturation protein HypF